MYFISRPWRLKVDVFTSLFTLKPSCLSFGAGGWTLCHTASSGHTGRTETHKLILEDDNLFRQFWRAVGVVLNAHFTTLTLLTVSHTNERQEMIVYSHLLQCRNTFQNVDVNSSVTDLHPQRVNTLTGLGSLAVILLFIADLRCNQQLIWPLTINWIFWKLFCCFTLYTLYSFFTAS